MKLIYTPTLPPGCCFICRASIRDSYIDTGVSIDYEGAFYLCNTCVQEMARMYAYLSHDEYKDLRTAKEELEQQNFTLIKRLGELENIESALVNAGYKRLDDGSIALVGGYVPETSIKRETRTQGTTTAVGTGEGTTFEQSDDEGMGELRPDESSSDNEFALEF